MNATIAALSSPAGPARRGVLRISGDEAEPLLRGVVPATPTPLRRGAFAGRFHDGRGEQPVLVLWMPGPGSYTREDVAEFHLPGAPALLQRALERLLSLGARPAGPGEFTRRAFLHGRIDLSRAEGVLALVEAADDAERRAALGLLGGGLGERVAALREGLAELCSLCEAGLDFEEADTGSVPYEVLEVRLEACLLQLREALAFEVRRQAPGTLARVVLVGEPNAGKSTLFNALGGERALTSDHAGTTRDLLYALWEIEGVAGGGVRLCDTPGLEEGAEGVDRRAQENARRELESAELHLLVVDARRGLGERSRGLLEGTAPCQLVWNQCDRPDALPPPGPEWCATSAVEGSGLEELAGRVRSALARPQGAGGGVGSFLFARHRAALERAYGELARSRVGLADRLPQDLLAQGLREGLQALDDLEGRTTAEDLLDRIFARFCLGK